MKLLLTIFVIAALVGTLGLGYIAWEEAHGTLTETQEGLAVIFGSLMGGGVTLLLLSLGAIRPGGGKR